MASGELTSGAYIKHHLQNLTYGKFPDGHWGFAENAIEAKEMGFMAFHVDNPKEVTEKQMDSWVKEFNSWDICDSCCMHLFDRTPYAYKKAFEWAKSEKEFIRRASFALIASLAIHDKEAPDAKLEKFLPLIKKYSTDERNFVRKAVNWALRQIGKRNLSLNKKAIKVAKEIKKIDSKAARWIAADALRELTSPEQQKRLKSK